MISQLNNGSLRVAERQGVGVWHLADVDRRILQHLVVDIALDARQRRRIDGAVM